MGNNRPNYVEHIVCLANSRKVSGRCIAGKRINDSSWCRPISKRPGHEISEYERRYEDGSTAQVLDLIDIPCVHPCPVEHQIENVLIDERFYWRKQGRLRRWHDVVLLLDRDADFWANGHSSYYNQNNRVPVDKIEKESGSLRLIGLDEIALHAGPKAPEFGDNKMVVRASFKYKGMKYILDVTDPVCEQACMSMGAGDYRVAPAIACISLTRPYTNPNGDTFAYKLVASIITRARLEA